MQNSAPQRVQLLDSSVAEKIAAGEVIERPASVVKELIENSLDAGATEICVVLEDGGKSLIEIIDNGCGMVPEDLSLCIQRHATSKLRALDDLERLKTLGFRGEALPSVAAASDLNLISRPQGSETAHELEARPGARPKPVTFGYFLGSPHGTRVRAREIFAQIPARLKFLKSQGAEVSQVREWIERLALAHPAVGFRLVSDDRTLLNLRPEDEARRVSSILSDGEGYPLVSASTDQSYQGFQVRMHWLQGLSTQQARKLVQVVNGRAVKDRMLQQATLSPFKQILLPGQFPGVALYVEINPGEIDVNVHPAKTEIRFLDSRKIFQAVHSLVEAMIERSGAPGVATSPLAAAAPAPGPWHAPERPVSSPTPWRATESFAFPTTPMAADSVPTPRANPVFVPFQTHQFVGTFFNTYLAYDLGEELGLVDQHAAHERIRYERLRRKRFGAKPSTQALLIPEAVHFASESRLALEERLHWLTELGFELEIFGENAVLFRGVPPEWGTDELRIRLKNLIERVLAAESDPKTQLLMDEKLFESLASEACHSAVRAGDRLDAGIAQSLVAELFECEHPWNCPHGRPTIVKVPRGRLEEWFHRRV